MTDRASLSAQPGRRVARTTAGVAVTFAVLVAGLFAGTGWLYLLRGVHLLGFGPRIADALPLLQLADFDGQPLGRVMVAWLLAGVLAGVALRRLPRAGRVPLAAIVALVLLVIAAQGSYALARNLRFSGVLWSHWFGVGPLLEAAVFTLGCALPAMAQPPAGRRPSPARAEARRHRAGARATR